MRVIFIIVLFFLGCSTKIDINSFHPVNVKTSYTPSKNEILSKTQILIVSKNPYLKNSLKEILSNYKPIKVLNRNFKSLKDEIKLAELAKESNSNLNQADYIIKASINSIQKESIYHPPVYWRDKKGKLHVQRAYFTHRVCVSGELEAIKLPQNYIAFSKNLNDCQSQTSYYRYFNFSPLIISATKNSIYSIKNNLYRFFAKRGYIFEVREKDNKFLLHTTLGSDFGAKKGASVDIFRIKKVKIPFTDNYKTTIVKIGSGKIVKVEPNSSWILTDKKVLIGDFVKMNYKTSFWDIFL
jgi:hypothetical protein